MRTAAVISEYNPFHSGHRYHIRKTREAGATHIVALMSGNAVQRGDIAVMDAYDRAKEAVRGGVDLVLEMPPQFSLSPARDFARAGVDILLRLGCVDILSFGAETPDIPTLANALEILTENELRIKVLMSGGRTYPQAASEACGEEAADVIRGQNNTLALEYLRALKGSSILPLAIKRTLPHDSEGTSGEYASASAIRQMLRRGENAERFLGYSVDLKELSFIENGDRAILYRLSAMTEEEFANLPGAGETAARLFRASRRANSLEELFFEAKSRNFTLSKIRRTVLLAALGITKKYMAPQPFSRVLALNSRGAEILKKCRETSKISIGGSLADLSKESAEAKRLAELIERVSRLRGLCRENIGGKSEFLKSARMQEGE